MILNENIRYTTLANANHGDLLLQVRNDDHHVYWMGLDIETYSIREGLVLSTHHENVRFPFFCTPGNQPFIRLAGPREWHIEATFEALRGASINSDPGRILLHPSGPHLQLSRVVGNGIEQERLFLNVATKDIVDALPEEAGHDVFIEGYAILVETGQGDAPFERIELEFDQPRNQAAAQR